MAKQLQLRRGTTSQHSTFTGANGEVTIDTDKKVVVVHDGATAGGIPLAKQATVDSKVTKVTSTDNAIVRFNGTTGEVQNSGVIIDDSWNVGIGTSSPDSRLHIASSGVTTLHLENILSTGDGTHDVSIQGYKPYVGYSNVILDFSSYIFKTSAQERMRIDSSGNLLLNSGTGALGYGTGAGGTVTQLTSKGTAVTLNKPTGQILTSNSALAAGDIVSFVLFNNTYTSITDILNIQCVNGSSANKYNIWAVNNGPGFGIVVFIKNISASTLSDVLTINFSIIKGANS